MVKTIIVFSVLATMLCCQGQEISTQELRVSDFKFESIFGYTSNDAQSTYCLLGTGFFRTPRSENSDSLVTSWISKHPNGLVVPVSAFGPVGINEPDSRMVYCWIIDGQDTLNNILIRNGCYPGGTMMRPKTVDEMEQWERELHEDSKEESKVEVHVSKVDYDMFIEQIKSAELIARNNKSGIWKEEEK